jgi:hypothetical protein
MWSRHSVESHWVREEADEGLKRNILVPVLVQEVAPPFGFRSIQAAKLADWSGDPAHPGLETLTKAIQRLASRDRSEPIKDTSDASAIPAVTHPREGEAKRAWNRRAVIASTIGAGTLLAAGAAVKFWPKPSTPLAKGQPALAGSTPVAKNLPRRKRRGPKSVSSALSPGFYTNRRTSIIHRVLVARKIGHLSFISEANLRPLPPDAFENFRPGPKGLPHVHLTASSQAFEDAALDLVRRKDPGAAIDLLRAAITHDQEIQRRSACKPSFRLYDLLAGLSIRHAQTAQLRAMTQDLADAPHASLFADRIAKWTNTNSRWYKGWSTRTNQKQWGGLPM